MDVAVENRDITIGKKSVLPDEKKYGIGLLQISKIKVTGILVDIIPNMA